MVRITTDSGQASGFIFETTDGGVAYVLTNFHVIEGAEQVEVRAADENDYIATVLGYDANKDLAVLEICCGVFEVLSIQDPQAIEVGAEVIAIGFPLGLEGSPTVTSGIVSALRYVERYQSWIIQTDAPINPGSSGGPLLFSTGEVAGVISSFVRDQRGVSIDGVSFAISWESVLDSLSSLREGKRVDLPTPAPTPSPTPEAAGWRAYTDPRHGYGIEFPSDWEMDNSDEARLDLVSPDGAAAVHVFMYDSPAASLEAWVQETIVSLREYHADLFEIIDQFIEEDEGGTGAAAILYRARTSPEFCTTLRSHLFVTAVEVSLVVETRVCEEFGEEYMPVLEGIVTSIFQE